MRGDTRGAEHIGPDDVVDADYGRLLDRAGSPTGGRLEKPGRGKGVPSPTGTERRCGPNFRVQSLTGPQILWLSKKRRIDSAVS
jgi:hypothetical protein